MTEGVDGSQLMSPEQIKKALDDLDLSEEEDN
jgi:hypothetical protein